MASSQTFSNASELTILVTFLRMNPVIASCSGACNDVTAWPTSGGRSSPATASVACVVSSSTFSASTTAIVIRFATADCTSGSSAIGATVST